MTRRPAQFTQADVARALRAIEQVGVDMCVEILKDGTIRLVPRDEKVDSEREIKL